MEGEEDPQHAPIWSASLSLSLPPSFMFDVTRRRAVENPLERTTNLPLHIYNGAKPGGAAVCSSRRLFIYAGRRERSQEGSCWMLMTGPAGSDLPRPCVVMMFAYRTTRQKGTRTNNFSRAS